MAWKYVAPLYISWRIYAANRMPILDCDEVFNYWEPLHFLIYGKGLQTWEYAPDFALRTYAYLFPLKWLYALLSPVALSVSPMLVSYHVNTERLAVFVMLRSALASLSACSELLFLSSLSEDVPFAESLTRTTLVPKSVSYTAAVLFLTSTGMTHAAAAFLPSSSVMILWMLCASCYVRSQVRSFCALAVVATLCLGWPFGVVVFVPMGIDILRVHNAPVRLLGEVSVWTILVQAMVMLLDNQHYGRWTSATLNIFRYNAQSGGDELYGVEPASFYLKNLLLNFNFLFPLALLFLPQSALLRRCLRPLPTQLIVVIAPFYIWLSLVVPRPHKEERFLFPIYPALILASVIVVQQTWSAMCLGKVSAENSWKRNLWILFFLPSVLISQSRSMALSKYYTAPLTVFASLPPSSSGLVCLGGEWYRFPSSFFLPQGYDLGFLPSSFSGQLPKYFEAEGSKVGSNFNSANKEEHDRYVHPDHCDFMVHLKESSNNPDQVSLPRERPGSFSGQLQEYCTQIVTMPFLNAEETSNLHRILYIPKLHKAVYHSYSLCSMHKKS